MLMLQFRHSGPAPSLDEVARIFSLEPDEIDAKFGVIATDPQVGLYAVRIKSSTEQKINAALALRPRYPDEGLFGDTRVEPFGLPTK